MVRASKAEFLKNARLQKEQIQLSKIEQELTNILGTVNEAINELKVEELQLKAAAAAALSAGSNFATPKTEHSSEQPGTSHSDSSALTSLSFANTSQYEKDIDLQIDDGINKQTIDLNMSVNRRHFVEEEEDDDM